MKTESNHDRRIRPLTPEQRRQLRQLLQPELPAWLCQDPEVLTRQLLLELGAPDHLLGHGYTIAAVVLLVQGDNYIRNITFGLYPQVAAAFDTTAGRVERAIRNLIEVTWTRADLNALERCFGSTVSPHRGKPTNSTFLLRLANLVRQQMKAAEGWQAPL